MKRGRFWDKNPNKKKKKEKFKIVLKSINKMKLGCAVYNTAQVSKCTHCLWVLPFALLYPRKPKSTIPIPFPFPCRSPFYYCCLDLRVRLSFRFVCSFFDRESLSFAPISSILVKILDVH
ncbi:conserved hypothetical protein [Ricinus communis]|uniref:Uncharacterized protein n=1 Tax=Ricinus communis TaxID=3988 RepID=B9SSD3_RICCO|nr:conserved hypothetical protein [Ricinus communis]